MFLKLGTVGRALGLQGSFYVSGRDEPIPNTIKSIRIGNAVETARTAEIISLSWQHDRPLMKCSLAQDRTSAEVLRGMSIWVEADQVTIDDSKEFFLKDLIGRSLYDSEGLLMGTVNDVVILPASINLIIVSTDNQRDVEIPVIADYVDMQFQRNDSTLRLVVPASTFEEIWNQRRKK